MKVIIRIIVFLFFSTNSLAQDRLDLLKELAAEGKHELIINSLSPILEKPECKPYDYFYLIDAYIGMGDHENGLAYSEKWINESLKTSDTTSIVTASRIRTTCLIQLNEVERGIQSVNFTLGYYIENDSIGITTTNLRLAVLYQKKGEFDKAYDVYRNIDYNTIEACNKQDEYFSNLAIINANIGNLDSCIYYSKQAIKFEKDAVQKVQLLLSYSNIAAAYIDLSQFEKALDYIDSAAVVGVADNHPVYELVYRNYYTAYSNLGMIDSAFTYVRKLDGLNKLLFQEKMDREILELKASYDREANLETKIIMTSRDLKKSKEQLLVWIIIVLLIVILAGGIILYMRYKNLKSSRDNLLVTQRLLRSQMTPHFIFNSLSVLQGMILSKEEENAVLYLSKFSKLLRTILENSRYKTVSLSAELAAIDNYMILENFDVETPYNYRLTIDEEINTRALQIPPMLIQPFIKNAIKHAFMHEKGNFEIKVQLTFSVKQLTCTIADNGIGINASGKINEQDKSSLATAITSERLAMLAKDFKMKGSVTIIDKKEIGEKGTLVTLVIPYKIELMQ